LGWRRKQTIIKPLVRQLSFGQKIRGLEKILICIDKVLNRYLTDRYARSQPQLQASLSRNWVPNASECRG